MWEIQNTENPHILLIICEGESFTENVLLHKQCLSSISMVESLVNHFSTHIYSLKIHYLYFSCKTNPFLLKK